MIDEYHSWTNDNIHFNPGALASRSQFVAGRSLPLGSSLGPPSMLDLKLLMHETWKVPPTKGTVAAQRRRINIYLRLGGE